LAKAPAEAEAGAGDDGSSMDSQYVFSSIGMNIVAIVVSKLMTRQTNPAGSREEELEAEVGVEVMKLK
jgi:hypothetical protein